MAVSNIEPIQTSIYITRLPIVEAIIIFDLSTAETDPS